MPRQGALWPQGHEHSGTNGLPSISGGRSDSGGRYLSLGVLGFKDVIVGRWPALEQRAAPIDLGDALHLPGAGVQIVLEHLYRVVDFIIGVAAPGKLLRAGHHPGAADAVFDVELIEDTGHFRLPLFRLG